MKNENMTESHVHKTDRNCNLLFQNERKTLIKLHDTKEQNKS